MYIIERNPDQLTKHGKLTKIYNCPKCSKYADWEFNLTETTTYMDKKSTYKHSLIYTHSDSTTCVLDIPSEPEAFRSFTFNMFPEQ